MAVQTSPEEWRKQGHNLRDNNMLQVPHWTVGFRVSGFGSDLGFGVESFGFRVSVFGSSSSVFEEQRLEDSVWKREGWVCVRGFMMSPEEAEQTPPTACADALCIKCASGQEAS